MSFQSLRTKLTIAHILPILVLMPFLNLYLLYSLEQFFTQKLLQRLSDQAYLLLTQVEQQPALMENSQAAQSFLDPLAAVSDARVLLLSEDGTILGSTRPEDATVVGTHFLPPPTEQALQGVAQGTGDGRSSEVAFTALPIVEDGRLRGVLRLSYEVADVRAQFTHLRWLLVGGFGVTTLLALGLGVGLAGTITQPLDRLMQHARAIASGNYQARVQIRRKDEIGALGMTLNQMAATLEEAQMARRRQVAAIVHELSRPLAGMHAAVETLLEDEEVDPTTSRDLLNGVADEISRLERLVATLQVLDRRTLQPIRLERSRVALDRVVHATAAMFEPLATRRGIALEIDLPAGLPELTADEDRLIQVLTNLIDNALKFTPEGGRVLVKVEDRAEGICVTVGDTGLGIAPDELPHLFQQFYRGDESRPPEKRGLGLGLTLCREIITAHHGQVWVESQFGKGARFSFSLPKA
jgi:signal transduction histidine kinase